MARHGCAIADILVAAVEGVLEAMRRRTAASWHSAAPARAAAGCAIALAYAAVLAAPAAVPNDPIGAKPFTHHRDPPSYVVLSGDTAARYDLGHAAFNSDFLPPGTPDAGRRAGLGPLFNAASCDECHAEGADGRGPVGEGPAPSALVVQLESLPGDAGDRAAVLAADPPGDPVYGRVFNTAAVEGVLAEGEVLIHYRLIERTYPDGSTSMLREPRYELTQLRYGPLSAHTLIKPRLAPALFGVGLLEAVKSGSAAAADGSAGRFGWQESALSIRDQTTRAFAREMGVTSTDRPADDCTDAERACRRRRHDGAPELSPQLLEAIITFQKWLAVPQPPPLSADKLTAREEGERLFVSTGCAGCHAPRQTVDFLDPAGRRVQTVIAPYTDLRLHDLGDDLADRDVAGIVHASRWRTAPLWGLGYRLGRESRPTFLHDGRARSPEEAILWHGGEAAAIRDRFEHLPREQRAKLLEFLGTL